MSPITAMPLDALLKNALPFLASSLNDSGGGGTATDYPAKAPDQILSKLVHESASLASTARLDPSNPTLSEFLHRCAALLTHPTTRPLLRSKILLLLSNFFLYNVLLRKSAANSAQICLAICHCLRAALDEHLGPQNLIDVLRVIQMLTYERVNFGDWTNELLPFLTRQILDSDCVPSSAELLPYCMCILCNLVGQSKQFTTHFKEMDSFKTICSRILQLLSHNSKAVVVSALVLVGYLDEKSRDTVYSPQNISQTFLCIFNILSSASPVDDVLMTTHIAADLLHRLVIGQPKTPNDLPLLNATARNLSTYDFFDKSIQKTAALLNVLDPRSEESRKIFHLLLSFCQVDELRGPIAAAIVAVEPNEQRLNTPAQAMVNTARLTFEEAIFPEVPLTALQLLAFVIKESVDVGKGIRRLFSSSFDPLCALIGQTLRTVRIDPLVCPPLAPFHAKQIAEALRLAESLANDDDFRPELLDIVHAQLCSDILDHQLNTNPIVNHWLFTDTLSSSPSAPIYNYDCSLSLMLSSSSCSMSAPPSSSKRPPSLPLWSLNAIPIPIQLMRLLASLKDHSKAHKELYWRSLKDHRLLPFMAYAIARGNSTIVYDAFVLFTHCAQLHDFPLKKLSILTAKCASMKNGGAAMASRGGGAGTSAAIHGQQSSSKDTSFSSSFDHQQQHHESNNNNNSYKNSNEMGMDQKLSASVNPMNNGSVTNDGITGTGNGVPSDQQRNIRRFVAELEQRLVESEAEIAALCSEKRELAIRVGHMANKLDTERVQNASAMESVRRDRQMLVEENERERALHAVMRDKFDELKRKFDTIAKTVLDKQSELEQMTKINTELSQQLHAQAEELERRRAELATATKIVAERDTELKGSECELAKCREENTKLDELRQQMVHLLEEFGANLGK
ncbi:hypothetical protein niasHS_008228 [Heterodera schachtii]|uniref:CIP2A N-terminal domain-containing protein n=2 Tax=Heterodera TaxID=34509 RepID=A0ABD2J4H8_HETSC